MSRSYNDFYGRAIGSLVIFDKRISFLDELPDREKYKSVIFMYDVRCTRCDFVRDVKSSFVHRTS